MLSNDATRATTPALQAVAPGVTGWRNIFVNLYYVWPQEQEGMGASWVLVDAGLPASADYILEYAAELFGPDNPPQAIVLTHGHFDHVSALPNLLKAWPEVQVYAHRLELPYLTGRSAYPAPDPTVGGGGMATLSFLYPKKPLDLGGRVEALPDDGTVPGLPGWQWFHTPGHTPGHVSFFRENDRALLAGDAFTTVKGESMLATWTQKQEVHGPPAYFTPDWEASRLSVERLAKLEPEVAATGHGIAMVGDELRQQLQELVDNFQTQAVPAHGRYVKQPAVADASGVVSVPPPVVSPWVKGLVVAGVAGLLFTLLRRKQA
ncbi:MBL fold metallo-hydrolase [Hymenobacter sp. BT507]|uniref:MBL fold metallo-hydrolase n=2 Tax=Hymenobacter citatus TaxID=2763506 RepID=A0ABR7MNF6_9BACT|nr:MBL fold metallo-hydrolase [Hymenobacter citatus]